MADSLSVLLGAAGEDEEILAVLADYAAAGLVAPFVWVDAGRIGAGPVPATVVRDGVCEAVPLPAALTGDRYRRLRIAVLVAADAPPGERVPRSAERALEHVVRSAAVGAPITLLRLLYSHGAVLPGGYDPGLILEGWHNLLVAPEDPAGPDLGGTVLGRLTDPLDVARYVAPVVATAVGLWSGIEQTVFDELAILPGRTLRAVRAHYRQLDATGVEDQLRNQLFGADGRLPVPRGGTTPVVHVTDTALATRTMARALWAKHRAVLRGPRATVDDDETQAISAWAALRMFLAFLAAAMRNAPAAWLTGVRTAVSSAVATTVQHAVFGRAGSAYSVVTGAELGSWQDIGRGADEIGTVLDSRYGPAQPAQADLSALWLDYANGALTLADGGRRSAGLDPMTVGAAIGVVPAAADIVPGSGDAFTAVPGSLAALTGVSRLAGGDLLAAARLRGALHRAVGDPVAGVEARQTQAALTDWERRTAQSYAGQVGAVLTDFLDRARTEVGEVVGRIRAASGQGGVDERLRRRQQTITTITRTVGWVVLATLVVLLGGAGIGWLRWRFALTAAAAVLAAYLAVGAVLFVLGQRHLFAELNLRESQLSELKILQANLRAALADVSRLSQAYGQFLSRNQVLGEVLRAPFGPLPAAQPRRVTLTDGLPRSVRIGVAAPTGQDAETTALALQQRLFTVGWLTDPWTRLLESATRRLHEEPPALFALPGVGSGSVLDSWAGGFTAGTNRSEGAGSLWRQARAMLDDPAGELTGALTAGVLIPGAAERLLPAQFDGGVLRDRDGAAAPFDKSLFTDVAVTAGRSAVAIDRAAVVRDGLGYRAAVIQVSDGLPAYDFALFPAVPAGVGPGPAGRDGEDVPPGSGSLVF